MITETLNKRSQGFLSTVTWSLHWDNVVTSPELGAPLLHGGCLFLPPSWVPDSKEKSHLAHNQHFLLVNTPTGSYARHLKSGDRVPFQAKYGYSMNVDREQYVYADQHCYSPDLQTHTPHRSVHPAPANLPWLEVVTDNTSVECALRGTDTDVSEQWVREQAGSVKVALWRPRPNSGQRNRLMVSHLGKGLVDVDADQDNTQCFLHPKLSVLLAGKQHWLLHDHGSDTIFPTHSFRPLNVWVFDENTCVLKDDCLRYVSRTDVPLAQWHPLQRTPSVSVDL